MFWPSYWPVSLLFSVIEPLTRAITPLKTSLKLLEGSCIRGAQQQILSLGPRIALHNIELLVVSESLLKVLVFEAALLCFCSRTLKIPGVQNVC